MATSIQIVVRAIDFAFIAVFYRLLPKEAVGDYDVAALLVSLGAVMGGLPLFWTLIVPVAVAAVIACSVALARRAVPAA